MPAGATSPSGSTSWLAQRQDHPVGVAPVRPAAPAAAERRLLELTPGRERLHLRPRSLRPPGSPRRCAGPSIGVRRRGSRPSRIDSPRRRSSIRPTSARPSAQSRLAEFPPDTTSSVVPSVASSERARSDSSPMLRSSGTTPLWQARLVPMPRRVEVRQRRRTCRATASDVVGQDALAEVAELDHEHHAVVAPLPRRRGRELREHDRLAVQAHVGARDDPVDLARQRRPDQRQRRR